MQLNVDLLSMGKTFVSVTVENKEVRVSDVLTLVSLIHEDVSVKLDNLFINGRLMKKDHKISEYNI